MRTAERFPAFKDAPARRFRGPDVVFALDYIDAEGVTVWSDGEIRMASGRGEP